MFVAIHIGQLLVPTHQLEFLGILRPQPPMVGLAFQVQAVVAAIGVLNFHNFYYILPRRAKKLRLHRLLVRLAKATSGYPS